MSPDKGYQSSTKNSSSRSDQPRKFRLLGEIYDETEEVEKEEELLLCGINNPSNYEQAMKEESREQAVRSEIEAIEKNDTCKLEKLPPGHKPIGLKWVYKLKRDTSGNVIKYKARLVAKGYIQI